MKKLFFLLFFTIQNQYVISMEVAKYVYFFALCEQGDVKAVEKFLCKNPTFDINHQDEQGTTALICAADFFQWDVVLCLLKHCKNANIMLADNYGQTLFSKAVYYTKGGYSDLVLLRTILTIYSLGEINNLCKTICLFRSKNRRINPTIEASVTQVLEGKKDVNSADYQGITALNSACAFGYLPFTIRLLELGASLDIQDAWGESAYTELQRKKAQFFVVRETFNSGSCFANVPAALISKVLKKHVFIGDCSNYIKQWYVDVKLSESNISESPKARIWKPVCVDACKIMGIEDANERYCLTTILLMPQEQLTKMNIELALKDK